MIGVFLNWIRRSLELDSTFLYIKLEMKCLTTLNESVLRLYAGSRLSSGCPAGLFLTLYYAAGFEMF